MGQKLLFTQSQKQQILACLLQGLPVSTIAKQYEIPRVIVAKWAKCVSAHDISWAVSDDINRQTRMAAYELFEQGRGCKFCAKQLQIPLSRIKYWKEQYRTGNTDFFFFGKTGARAYPAADKERILREYLATNEPKKTFCRRAGVTPATLRRWLKESKTIK